MIQATENKNPHINHRKRMYALAEKVGVENLTDIQMLELLLTYIIPRKDTNETAHKLLEEFGSFSAVLDAPISALQRIEGIGKRTAQMISFMPKFFFLYRTKVNDDKIKLNSRQSMYEYVENFLKYSPKEEFYIIALNSSAVVVKCKKISEGGSDMVEVDIKKIIDFISTYSPNAVVIAHSHGEQEAMPSTNDINSTKIISNLIRASGVKFVDHIIVGKGSLFSFHDKGLLN